MRHSIMAYLAFRLFQLVECQSSILGTHTDPSRVEAIADHTKPVNKTGRQWDNVST